MRLSIVAALCLSTAYANTGTCIKGPSTGIDLAEDTSCIYNGVYACHKPLFQEYTGLTVDYGCNTCVGIGRTEGVDCTYCNSFISSGGTSNCNTVDPDEVAGTTFKCASWEYKEDKIVRKAEDTVCQLKKGSTTPVGCHGPTDKSHSTYAELFGGCGPCDETAKSEGKCRDCDGELCNVAIPALEGSDSTFKCASWEYKDDKFVRKDEDTVCSTTPVICNGPSDTAGAAYVEEKDGCGSCDVTAEVEGKCTDCYEELCNSAATMTTLLATMTTLLAISASIYNFI